MRVVLDTSAIIYLNDFRMFEEIFTVNEVINEVRDKINVLKLSGLSMKVVQPSETSVKEIKRIAVETGDLEKLSRTDLKVLALAKENNLTIISDDYNVQNVAEKCGIKYISLFSKRIAKLIQWGNYCTNCKRFFENKRVCYQCGNRLVRKPKEIEVIRTEN